jgi:hypothetical protein
MPLHILRPPALAEVKNVGRSAFVQTPTVGYNQGSGSTDGESGASKLHDGSVRGQLDHWPLNSATSWG